MARIELPDGAWAEVRDDLQKAPRRLTKAIDEAQMKLASLPSILAAAKSGVTDRAAVADLITADDMTRMQPLSDAVNDATIVALVTAWSFDSPISIESLDELPADAYAALVADAENRSGVKGVTKADLLDPTPALEGSSA
jgi:hypothetical protein